MQLPPPFLEELRARTPLAELIGGRVRLSRAGRQWKGCCPFHDEKTPSFQVYDDHFHCYGCGAHGDAISFVMQSQGLGFMEAVTELASRAGLAVPKPSAEATAAEAARQDAFSALEAATRVFSRRLFLPEGAAALGYLRERGLREETIRGFGLGWSGEGRGALLTELGRAGFSAPLLASAGLLKENENSSYYEFFFNRIMFPIRDSRGRVISFGGRALGEGQPKYLNGPETEVFSKRRVIYGLDQARPGLRASPPIVVEGYMDVIQLHQAGFATAVAPLGTALTEEQLQTLWRFTEAPVICFDGDAAGRRAAARVVDLALPMLAPNRRLAFAILDGEDPDSLIRKGRAAELSELLRQPLSFEEAHFRVVRELKGDTSWDRRAKLLEALRAGASRIPDPAGRVQYRRELERLFYERYPSRPPNAGRGSPRRDVDRSASIAGRGIVTPHRRVDSRQDADLKRARLLTAILIQWPALLHAQRLIEAYGRLELPLALGGLRQPILDAFDSRAGIDSEGLMAVLRAAGLEEGTKAELEAVLRDIPKALTKEEAEQNWWEVHGWLARLPALALDRMDSQLALGARFDDQGTQKLLTIKEEENAVLRGGSGDEGA